MIVKLRKYEIRFELLKDSTIPVKHQLGAMITRAHNESEARRKAETRHSRYTIKSIRELK